MREREIEQYFIRRVREAGGLQRKFVSPGHRGVPDRIVVLGSKVHFVELKRPGEEADEHQKREHLKIMQQGVPVFVLDTKEAVDLFLLYVTR